MLAYLSAVLSGTAEPFWPHLVLISVSVAASFAVAGGIIFESPKYSPAIHRIATSLVIGGVAVEALCMVCLFVVDEAISSAQQVKIIALETKLAPRSLSDAEVAEISGVLKKFDGQEFTVAGYDGEPASIASRVKHTLEKSDWKYFTPELQILALPGTVGIQVWAYSEGPTRDAATALVAALNGKAIDAQLAPDKPQDPTNKKIEIIVGSKF
jgi:hypothetical protein